jgi:hypothetical protein
LKCARSFVLGDVLGCCLGAAGRWQNWEPPAGQPWVDLSLHPALGSGSAPD